MKEKEKSSPDQTCVPVNAVTPEDEFTSGPMPELQPKSILDACNFELTLLVASIDCLQPFSARPTTRLGLLLFDPQLPMCCWRHPRDCAKRSSPREMA
jgi:hypothetical protein